MRPESALRPYQDEDAASIVENESMMIWSDVGLGKTAIALTAMVRLFNSLTVHGCLVVAPLAVVKAVWRQEAAEWEHTQHVTFSVVHGGDGNGAQTEAARVEALNTPAMVYLINYEGLPWLVDRLAKEGRIPFNMAVYDEVTKMKNGYKRASRRGKSMGKLLPLMDRVVGLTGTPAPNGYLDLYGQYLFVDKGARLGTSRTAYRDQHFMADYMGYNWSLRAGAKEQITGSIADITRERKKEDYLDLPPVVEQDRKVLLSSEERKAYDELEKEFFVALDGGGEVEAFNKASLSNKCRQFANGACYDTEERTKWHHTSDAKLNSLKELVEELGDEPVLISYNFKHDLERIKKAIPGAVSVKDGPIEEIVARWNRGEIKVLLGHPASMGHGLNLQFGGHYLVMFGCNWDLELYQQVIGRLDRPGQKNTVFVIRLLAENTVEDAVSESIKYKAEEQVSLREAVKNYRRAA